MQSKQKNDKIVNALHPKERMFSFSDKQFENIEASKIDEEDEVKITTEEEKFSTNNSCNVEDSFFTNSKEQKLMEEMEFLDWVIKATELEGKSTA